jgi:DNA-binding beta-propeller fold protein YncE
MKQTLMILLASTLAACGQNYRWVNFAGLPGTPGDVDGATGTSRLNGTYGADCDSSGNIYIADRVNSKIKKITSAGVVSTLSASGFNLPTHVVVNKSNGNLYVADLGNGQIKKLVSPYSSATVIATITAIGLGVDSTSDTVYVGDLGNNTIKKITSGGTVTTIAGSGTQGSLDGALLSARFNQPCGIAVDFTGNLWVCDRDNSTIRRIDFYSGQVITVAGLALTAGCADGPVGTSRLNKETGITLGPDGNFYIADQDNFTIRKLTRAGVLTTLGGLCGTSGGADGVGDVARFGNLGAVGVDSSGNLYAADRNSRVSKGIPPSVPSGYAFTNFAGLPGTAGNVDGATGTSRLNGTYGADCDSAGNIYIADRGNSKIKKISPGGVVTTLSASGFNLPTHVVVNPANGNLYVADQGNGLIKKLVPPYTSATTLATINAIGLGVDSATDTVYAGDLNNNTIKKVTSGGTVTTVAGNGTAGSTDGALLSAKFNQPCGIAVDATGNLWVADRNNNTIRRVDFYSNVVTTVAGSAGSSGCSDGTGSSARFNQETGITLGPDSNFYIADQDNFTIRKLTPGGVVTTLGGSCGTSGSADGIGSVARFGNVGGVGVNNDGYLFVADRNSRVSKATPPGPPASDLKYIGFWPGSLAPQGSIVEQYGYANFTFLEGGFSATLADQAIALGMKLLVPAPDFSDSAAVNAIKPYTNSIMAFFMMDEPDCAAGGNTTTLNTMLTSIETQVANVDANYPGAKTMITLGCGFWTYNNFRIPSGIDYIALESYGSTADPATTKTEWLDKLNRLRAYMNSAHRVFLMPLAVESPATESQLIQKADDIYNYATTDSTIIGVFPFDWYSDSYDCAGAGVFCGNGIPAMRYDIPVNGAKSARDLSNLRAHYVQLGQMLMSGNPKP